ncbi:Wollknaeuel [Operophtera brumata]|uniref:Wollknaeuel n=1 Tax=Operophtera brumata TaxID=104452 RepID=A0A0L7KIC7_OPEBR|nr:Wollknaeuel [Operophtera brumata]
MDIILTLWTLLLYAVFAAVTALTLLSAVLYLLTSPYPVIEKYKEEEMYNDPKTKKKLKFPSIKDACDVNLKRAKEKPHYKYEIIVVSDGSTDNTVRVAESYSEKYGTEKVRCLELIKNRGKGGAVRMGIECARGASILFADADGASKFEDLSKLEVALTDLVKYDVTTHPNEVCDSIALKHSDVRIPLPSVAVYREGYQGHAVWIQAVYQEGRPRLFPESSLRWTEIEGSKVTPVLSWIQMGCDLGLIWLKYTIGAWKIKSDEKFE